MKTTLAIILAAAMLVACSKKEEISTGNSDFKPMSNDDIINETKKCEAAGLDGESLRVKDQYGDLTVQIQCRPRAH